MSIIHSCWSVIFCLWCSKCHRCDLLSSVRRKLVIDKLRPNHAHHICLFKGNNVEIHSNFWLTMREEYIQWWCNHSHFSLVGSQIQMTVKWPAKHYTKCYVTLLISSVLPNYHHTAALWCMILDVGHCLATKVFVGQLLATGEEWIIIG